MGYPNGSYSLTKAQGLTRCWQVDLARSSLLYPCLPKSLALRIEQGVGGVKNSSEGKGKRSAYWPDVTFKVTDPVTSNSYFTWGWASLVLGRASQSSCAASTMWVRTTVCGRLRPWGYQTRGSHRDCLQRVLLLDNLVTTTHNSKCFVGVCKTTTGL